MTTTTDNPQLSGAETVRPAPALTPKIDPKWRLGPLGAVGVMLFAALFLAWNYLPLQSSDLWGQIIYGRWILEHRALPAEDPVMPLAEGMPVMDSGWLTQVALAGVASAGDQWLSVLFAANMIVNLLLLAGAYYLLSGMSGLAIVTALGAVAGGWMQYTGLQPPQLAGLCFASLLVLLAWVDRSSASAGHDRPAREKWTARLACFILFVIWTNLGGSFVWGLASLACFLCGRVVEVIRDHGSIAAVLRDRSVRDWLILVEIALVASLLNPYGIDLLLNVVWFQRGANRAELAQHRPLVLVDSPGREFAISVVVLLVALRKSRAGMPVSHGLLLGMLAVATMFDQSMIGWYMAAFGYVGVRHFAELWKRAARRWQREGDRDEPALDGATQERPAATWFYTMLAGLALWIAFSFSDASRPVLGGAARSAGQLYGPRAPLALAEHLRKTPPTEIAFSPLWWSDWLVLHGPEEFRPIVTSHVDSVPRQVWRDYHRIESGDSDWQRILDRYRINTVIADQERQRTLIRIIRTDPGWAQSYRDEQSIVFRRTAAKPTGQRTSLAGSSMN